MAIRGGYPDTRAEFIIDYMSRDDRTGPLDPAFLNLGKALPGGNIGRIDSGAEFKTYLVAIGFFDIEVS